MSLRDIASRDCQKILESTTGFGWGITVTDPSGTQEEMTGTSNDIALAVDPETGVVIEGRTATIELSLISLRDKGLSIPRNIPDKGRKPWLVTFLDLHGETQTLKVVSSSPDSTLGFVTCFLSEYAE